MESTDIILWLKELSKSWVNLVSDEVVYGEQILGLESVGIINISGQGRSYIKDYFASHLWFEVLLKIRMGGNLYTYVALIEASKTIPVHILGMAQAGGNYNLRQTRDNNAMFVSVADNLENPKRMSSLSPIRSVVRLQRLDIIPYFRAKAMESCSEIRVVFNVDRETGESVALDSESPCDVIKSGSQLMGNLSYEKPPGFRESSRQIRTEDITAILRVFINRASVRVTCNEGDNFTVEDIKVFLRPIDSSEGASHLLHMLYYPQGEDCGQRDTKDSKGTRDSCAQTQGSVRGSGKGHKARQDLNSPTPPEEVASQTGTCHRRGDCTAKHTRLGSPEDA